MTIRIITPRTVAAALVATALITSACSSEPEPLPKVVAETTTTAPPTSAEAPRKPSVCDDPTSEDLGDGFYQREQGSIHERVGEACLFRPHGLGSPATDAGFDEERSAEIAEQLADPEPVEVQPAEMVEQVLEAVDEAVPEGDTITTEAPTTTPPEPEPVPTTTTPPEPEPVPTTTTPPEPEPVPTTTTPPEPEPVPTTTTRPEPEIARTADGWIIPVAGTVPEVHPDTPLAEWQRGEVTPGRRPNDIPRQTSEVAEWVDWCTRVSADCPPVQHHMHQALDYLGAYPRCVLDIYTKRINYYITAGSGVNGSYAFENFGWHLCATVIDPIVADLPADRPATDVGYRLSDTAGITLAERCRIVLTGPFPDIQLETSRSAVREATRFGSDCDAWAAWVDGHIMSRRSPQCHASLRLAEEWMEHVHGQHERYSQPLC